MTKRVLFISYPFPPVGGAGVQRTTKFVKYLGHYGWQPSVLTVANPSVPAFDDSLLKDIPAGTVVCRAKTWEPSYAVKRTVSASNRNGSLDRGGARRLVGGAARWLGNVLLQPDVQVLWMPEAVRQGRRLLRRAPHAAIVASGPPFSTFLIGAALSRHSGLPLILDYRDEWGLNYANSENRGLDPLSRRIQTRMQRQAIRVARALVATTQSSAGTLDELRKKARSAADVTWIYNGFDADDFPVEPETRLAKNERYRLTYVGTLWNLTTVGPLVEAVRRLAQRSPSLAAGLELVFAGRRTPGQQEMLDSLKALPCRVVEHPYVHHHEAINLVRCADGLCLLLANVPGAERVVPAKVFEYMAARRPILAIAPPGEAWSLLDDYPAAHRFAPHDIEGICGFLANAIRDHGSGKFQASVRWNGSRYDRKSQAGQLAQLLNSLQPEVQKNGRHHQTLCL